MVVLLATVALGATVRSQVTDLRRAVESLTVAVNKLEAHGAATEARAANTERLGEDYGGRLADLETWRAKHDAEAEARWRELSRQIFKQSL